MTKPAPVLSRKRGRVQKSDDCEKIHWSCPLGFVICCINKAAQVQENIGFGLAYFLVSKISPYVILKYEVFPMVDSNLYQAYKGILSLMWGMLKSHIPSFFCK